MVEETQQPESSSWTYQGRQATSSNFVMTLIHLYRAEIMRANVWRNRLDTTTNWAVATVGAALTFTFSSAENPHFVLLLVLLLMLTFLYIEARRYRYYAMWYERVHLLETDFIAAMLVPPHQPSADWGATLHDSLTTPTFPISTWGAVGHRYRRNYIWLVSLLLCSWTLKLTIHPTTTDITAEIVKRAAIPPLVPGNWVIGVVGVIYIALLLLAVLTAPAFKAQMPQGRPLPGILPKRRPTKESLALIITTQRDAIAARLMHELHRGVTAVSGIGMYTQETRDVLLCALTDVQISQMQEIVRETDPGAFVIISKTITVRGGGFTPMEPPS